MKCPVCNGNGKFPDINHNYYPIPVSCQFCEGKGNVSLSHGVLLYALVKMNIGGYGAGTQDEEQID